MSSSGLSQVQDMGLQVFHAGTALKDGAVVSSGGRVLTVTAVRSSLETALQAANQGVAAVSFPGSVYRHDIGHRAIAHLNKHRCVEWNTETFPLFSTSFLYFFQANCLQFIMSNIMNNKPHLKRAAACQFFFKLEHRSSNSTCFKKQ